MSLASSDTRRTQNDDPRARTRAIVAARDSTPREEITRFPSSSRSLRVPLLFLTLFFFLSFFLPRSDSFSFSLVFSACILQARSSTHPENRRGRKTRPRCSRLLIDRGRPPKTQHANSPAKPPTKSRRFVDRRRNRGLRNTLVLRGNALITLARITAPTPDVENHLGVSTTYDPSPTRGRHAPQRDATRCNAGARG